MTGPIQKIIEQKLVSQFQPEHLQLFNESHQHSVPENSETHFKLLLVSEEFHGLNRVARQRKIYQLLSEELEGPVHALSLRLLTPEEWATSGESPMPDSPDCRGGSKA